MDKVLFHRDEAKWGTYKIQLKPGTEIEVVGRLDEWYIHPRLMELMEKAGFMSEQWSGSFWNRLEEDGQRRVMYLIGLVVENADKLREVYE